MFVKDNDLDGYNSQLSIKRNTQRSEIIISYSSSKTIRNYFDLFHFTYFTNLLN